jgi:hypothetical protein
VFEHDAAALEIGLREARDRPCGRRRKRTKPFFAWEMVKIRSLASSSGSSAVKSCRVIDIALPFSTVKSRSPPILGGTLPIASLP